MILSSRLSWVQEPKEYLGKDDEAFGVYSFGGIDDLTGRATNELFRLRPLTHENQKVVSLNQDTRGWFKQRATPEIVFRAEKL